MPSGGLTYLGVKFIDMNACEIIVLDKPLTDNNSVLKIESFEGHKADQHVLAQRQHTFVGSAAVGYNLVLLDLLAELELSAFD